MTTVRINMYSPGALYNNSQNLSSQTVRGGNIVQNWTGNSNQMLVGNFGNSGNDATWATPNGDLTAFVSGNNYTYTVGAITGFPTSSYTGFIDVAYVRAPQTTMAFGQAYHIDSFVQSTIGFGNNIMSTVTTAGFGGIGPITSGIVDASISILAHDAAGNNGFYRADFTFTAVAVGGVLNTIIPSSPISPLNVRSNGSMSGVTSQMSVSGNYVLLSMNVPSGVTYNTSIINQLQWQA